MVAERQRLLVISKAGAKVVKTIDRRVRKLEARFAPPVEYQPRDQYGRTPAEAIWEARRSRLTKEELILEERKMAILHEAWRGHRTIAEAIWRGHAALKKLEAGQE